jgi:hypothetical protein
LQKEIIFIGETDDDGRFRAEYGKSSATDKEELRDIKNGKGHIHLSDRATAIVAFSHIILNF